MPTTWTFHSAGQLVFGPGAASRLGEIALRFKAKKVLVVTDVVLLKAGVAESLHSSLNEAGVRCELFTGGEPEPSLKAAEASSAAARSSKPDAIIGLGGGSNMDLAKITAVLLTHGGHIRDYIGEDKILGPLMPLVCVPTTAGTGSEVSAATVLTDTENQIKVGILSNYLRPAVALVDPLLTRSCPPKVTADSGIDALTHAIEAYTAVDNARFPLAPGERSVYQGRNPMGSLFAEQAIHLVGRHLANAVKDGRDEAAREGMSLAATLAGLAFSNVGVALVHAMEYPVGGATHCSHGAGNGLLLPYVMRFNLEGREAEFAAVARLLGEETNGLAPQAAALKAVEAVEGLRRQIGIPSRLTDLGVKQSDLPAFAEKAASIKRILRVNPSRVTADQIEAIYRSAF